MTSLIMRRSGKKSQNMQWVIYRVTGLLHHFHNLTCLMLKFLIQAAFQMKFLNCIVFQTLILECQKLSAERKSVQQSK